MGVLHNIARFAVLFLLGCGSPTSDLDPSLASVPTYAQFRAQQPSSRVKLDPSRQAALVGAVASVHVGMSAHQVAAILGRPDFATPLAPKASPDPVGTGWVYLLVREDLDLVNEATDRAIVVYFGADQRVSRVHRQHV